VYLLPSLLTTGNIFCGFTSIVMTFNRDFRTAAILVIVAGVLDGLDGRIARLTGGTSEFGGEYDSLADVVSFGLAPSFLASVWGLASLRRYGWIISFLFLACGAVRLARFNIQHGASDRRWFIGLPIPMAATAVAGCTLYFENPVRDPVMAGLFAFLTLALSFLMVSRVRYRSFKDIDLRSRRSFRSIVPIAIALAAFALNPALAVLLIAAAYLLSGPALHLVYLRGLQRSGGRGGAGAASGEPVREVPVRES
jgi:CDP-diacylglycerol--serine O-phosphatidyltransferase